jgi:hypothetical protein
MALKGNVGAADAALAAVSRVLELSSGLPIMEPPDMPEMLPLEPEGDNSGLFIVFSKVSDHVERFSEVTPELILEVLQSSVVDGSRYLEAACQYEIHSCAVVVTGNAGLFIEEHRSRQPDWRGAAELVALVERHWRSAPFKAASALIDTATRVSPLAMIPLLDRIIAAPPSARRFLDPHPSWRVDGLRVRARKLRESARMWTEPEQPE